MIDESRNVQTQFNTAPTVSAGASYNWITVGQGPITLAVGAGGGGLDFLLSSILSPLSPSLWETARYRLKYCLKVPLNPNQQTNQLFGRRPDID